MAKDNDIDKLIELALGDGDTKPVSTAERYVLESGIEASDTEWVRAERIYWRYLHWFHDNEIGTEPVYRDMFFKLAMTQFKKKVHWSGGYEYAIKKEAFEMDKDEYRKMRQHLIDEKTDRNLKKKIAAIKKRNKKAKKAKNGDEKK